MLIMLIIIIIIIIIIVIIIIKGALVLTLIQYLNDLKGESIFLYSIYLGKDMVREMVIQENVWWTRW